MNERILTVTLNPVLDYAAQMPQFSLGKDFYLPKFTVSAGGKGINVSRALKNLGLDSLATGFVGGATGDLIKKMLTKEIGRAHV